MSDFWSANQYEQVFNPRRLLNYQKPSVYLKNPGTRFGFTRVLSNDRGHLLPGISRGTKNPWGNFVGCWDLPNKLPGTRVNLPTARRYDPWDKLKREADELQVTLRGMTKNGRRNMRLESIGFKVTKPSKLGSMSPAHDDPCKDVISKVPKEPEDEKFDLNAEVPEQPEVPVEAPPPPVDNRSPSITKELGGGRASGSPSGGGGGRASGSPSGGGGGRASGSPSGGGHAAGASPPHFKRWTKSAEKKKEIIPPFDTEGLTEEQKDLVERECYPCPPKTNREDTISPCENREQANRRLCAAHTAVFHPAKCLSPLCKIPEADRTDGVTYMFEDEMCRRSPFPREPGKMVKICGTQAPVPGQPCFGLAPCLAGETEELCPIEKCPRQGIDALCHDPEFNLALRKPPPPENPPTPPCQLSAAYIPVRPKSLVDKEYEKYCDIVARNSPKSSGGAKNVCGKGCRYPHDIPEYIPGSDENLAAFLRPRDPKTFETPCVCPQKYSEEDTAQFLTGPMVLESPREKERDRSCFAFY